MPIHPDRWLRGQTISNGSCGYHAMAEAFVRVARNRPELLNSEIFNPNNPIFAPAYHYLREVLGVEGAFDGEYLQRVLQHDFTEGHRIAQVFAPFMSILAASHYAVAILPWRLRYEQLRAARTLNDDSALELARDSMETQSPFGMGPRELEEAHYMEYLSYWISGFFDLENNTFLYMSARPFMHDFLDSERSRSNKRWAPQFQQMIYTEGLSPAEYPTLTFLENLCRLLYRPIHIEPDLRGDQAPIPYYPVSVIGEFYLSHADHPVPDEIIASVYRCNRGAHYEYAIPPKTVARFNERISSFTPGVRAPVFQPPKAPIENIQRLPAKTRRAQDLKAINMIRAKKYHETQKNALLEKSRAATATANIPIEHSLKPEDLNTQIKLLEQKIKVAEQKMLHHSNTQNKRMFQMRFFMQAKQEHDALKKQLQELKKKTEGEQKNISTPLVFSQEKKILVVSDPNNINFLEKQAKVLQEKKALSEEEQLELALILSEIEQKKLESKSREALIQKQINDTEDSDLDLALALSQTQYEEEMKKEQVEPAPAEDLLRDAGILYNIVFPYESHAQGNIYTFAAEQIEQLFHYELEKRSRTASPK